MINQLPKAILIGMDDTILAYPHNVEGIHGSLLVSCAVLVLYPFLEKVAFLPIFPDTLDLTSYQIAMFCVEEPGRWVPFSCVGVVIDDVDASGLKHLCKGEIGSQLVKRRCN